MGSRPLATIKAQCEPQPPPTSPLGMADALCRTVWHDIGLTDGMPGPTEELVAACKGVLDSHPIGVRRDQGEDASGGPWPSWTWMALAGSPVEVQQAIGVPAALAEPVLAALDRWLDIAQAGVDYAI